MRAYAAIYINENIRKESSSGGVFSAIAEDFEIVYGIAMTEDCYGAQMIRVEGDITSLRGSKYLQAKVGDIYKSVKSDLNSGRKVLFSGTGCQINGLKSYLGKNYDNLLCVDVVCHGVPSPRLWREYIKYQEERSGKVSMVNFRCKESQATDLRKMKNKLYIPKDSNVYMQMFLNDYCLRPSCYDCHAKTYRLSDLTIADFWGVNKIVPKLSDGLGVSLVIVRNQRGEALFESIKEKLRWQEVTYSDAIKCNRSECCSASKPIERDNFFNDLNSMDFENFSKKYKVDIKLTFSNRIKLLIKTSIKKILKLLFYKINLINPKYFNNPETYGMLLEFRDNIGDKRHYEE